jgi:peptidoglycan/LPS O-acetylase OafA/YrhL
VGRRAAAIYAIVVGLLMFGQWAMFLLTGNVPELQTEPIRIAFHLAGEFTTAALLIAGGFGLLTLRKWGYHVFLLALGMLLYTIIVSPGYFGQLGQWVFVLLFAVLVVLTVLFAVLAYRAEGELRGEG